MPIFEYQAQDGSGRDVRGTVMGSSLDVATDVLRQRGLTIQRLEPARDDLAGFAAAPTVATNAPPSGGSQTSSTDKANYVASVPLGQLAMFTRQLQTLLNAGIAPAESFANLSLQVHHPGLKEFCHEARLRTEKGEALGPIFNDHPGEFNALYRALIRAGEAGGFLPQALGEIASYIESEIELRNKYRVATMYPKALAVVAFFIVGLANVIGRSIAGRDIFQSPLHNPRTWLILGPVLIGAFVFFRYGTRVPEIKARHDAFLAALPWFGTTSRQFAMAKFGRAFGSLYRSGVAPGEALALSADAVGNESIRRAIIPAVENIRAGKGITESLAATGVFDSTVLQMISTGERTGQIDQMLGKMSDYYEQEASVRSRQTAVIIGILVLLTVVLYLGYLIITTAGPIINAYPEAMREADNAGQ